MTAEEIISELNVYFSSGDVALFLLMSRLERKPNKDVTIAIGVEPGELSLLYNPEFVVNTPVKEIREIVQIELTRLILQHPTLRVQDDPECNWMASNSILSDLYPGSKLSKTFKSPFKKDNFESYYYAYWDQTSKSIGSGNGQQGNRGQGQGSSGNGGQSPGNSNSGQGGPGQGGPGQGNGGGQSQQGNSGGMSQHLNNKNNAKQWKKDDILSEQMNEFVRENESIIKGSSLLGTGSIMEILLKMTKKPEVTPEQMLKSLIKSIEIEKQIDTWSRYNRRYGLDVPGYRKKMGVDCLFAIDVSGSISQSEIKRFANIVYGATKAAICSTISWDTKVYEKKPQNLKQYNKPIKIASGGGGTDPECVLEYAKKRRIKNIIFLTDGCFSELKSNSGMKLCFVCTEKPYNIENLKKMGKLIVMKKKKI